ncbi:hypothetical protein HDF16_004981 [Granulicella aggregans]|uniref:Uncharacterized protein n=1 Tax=Granulicella aggregans TaxID=474949 RepID=A0A7W8E7G8_9BACT|nr:hypothetical protein [Granulicella aggregans]
MLNPENNASRNFVSPELKEWVPAEYEAGYAVGRVIPYSRQSTLRDSDDSPEPQTPLADPAHQLNCGQSEPSDAELS